MELSMLLDYAGDPRRAADGAAALESAGLDAVWVAEAWGFDSPTIMGYLAARTERMKIGSAIVNVYSRTPALIAQTAAGLDAMSGGRALLGLGASGPQVIEGWHGKPYDKPLGRTRETVDLCRRIWRRETIDHHGITDMPLPAAKGGRHGKPLKILTRPVRDRIPVYVASLGPANVALTAEIADGWLPTLFIPEKARAVWGSALAEGAAKRAPELGPLQTVAGGLLAIGEDAAAARDLARPQIALYVGGMGAVGKNFYNDLAVAYGYEEQARRIQELYLAGRKRDAAAAVPDEFCELMTLCGPEGYVRERVEAFREAGVTMLNVTPVGPDPARLIETVKSWL
ncbi:MULTISPECIES: LLM class F420-dependent oxidoreductase [Streptomyces]|uniref:LLM class F420-dependent oxidoreductase n=1 Tax=Streptomyces katrae TaxID=68223 RepID=A0ABT7GNH4_9ACTN|nr:MULTISPECIES: LLM class F420-dependent oxidoreductase [Streptomyces]MDK9495131.1 LLM class F420-dependent oxidoreductase [Streptomyces katrae]RST00184.1 LLM class F420-dependent oxidoreductase [Streptomyces sp. WAC07149]GLX17664.1 LLM class F420-dependent oxidoreductase [Streptomyces lavendulae subsp. lavendulae]GLX24475.1 LLM class F420-dependent oxidoreductase [Streptomyces lavendulae subsp. lavendulae]